MLWSKNGSRTGFSYSEPLQSRTREKPSRRCGWLCVGRIYVVLRYMTPERRQTGPKRKHDALTLLQRDHEQAQGLYEGFQTAGGDDCYFLASRIVRLLEQHARLEEELFYPALQAKSLKEGAKLVQQSVQAALRDHRVIDKLIAKVRDRMAHDQGYHAQIDDLMEQVRHHVEEEERQIFP